MIGGSIATRNKKKYQRVKKVRADRKRMKRINKVGWKALKGG
jgi:tRNA U54 and U55 pseudouridine synthase Pus10